MRGYDLDDPARHLPFARRSQRSGWGLIAPQTYGGDLQIRMPVLAKAACADQDPDLFFPRTKAEEQAAKRVCRRCGIQDQCLSEAMRPNEIEGKQVYVSGIWGGKTEVQRRLMRSGSSKPNVNHRSNRARLAPRPTGQIVAVEPEPIKPLDRVLSALKRGAIVIDRGNDPALILPASATALADRLEKQGYKRIVL